MRRKIAYGHASRHSVRESRRWIRAARLTKDDYIHAVTLRQILENRGCTQSSSPICRIRRLGCEKQRLPFPHVRTRTVARLPGRPRASFVPCETRRTVAPSVTLFAPSLEPSPDFQWRLPWPAPSRPRFEVAPPHPRPFQPARCPPR